MNAIPTQYDSNAHSLSANSLFNALNIFWQMRRHIDIF